MTRFLPMALCLPGAVLIFTSNYRSGGPIPIAWYIGWLLMVASGVASVLAFRQSWIKQRRKEQAEVNVQAEAAAQKKQEIDEILKKY